MSSGASSTHLGDAKVEAGGSARERKVEAGGSARERNQDATSAASMLAWLLPFGLLVFAVVAVPLRILSEEGLPRYRKLSTQLTRLERENRALGQAIEQLSRDVKDLRADPRAVERIARDELGLIREGEVLFQFAPSEATFLTNQNR